MELVHLCREACRPDKRTVRLVYHCDAAHYVVRGYGFFNGRRLGPGEGFVCRAGQAVAYHPDRSDPWTYYWIRMEGDDNAAFFDLIDTDGDGVFRHRLERELAGLYALMQAMDSPMYASLKSTVFPGIAQKLHRPDDVCPRTAAEAYTEQVKQLIDSHLFENIRISEIADRLHLNRCYLRNVFFSCTGMSPCQYRQKKRMEYAAQLLRETRHSVGMIANSVGYDDQMQFSRAFKKAYRVSPTAYRAQHS